MTVEVNPPRLRVIGKASIQTTLNADEHLDEQELLYERNIYSTSRLNEGQKRIYDYVEKNPNNMIIIQAGPGKLMLVFHPRSFLNCLFSQVPAKRLP